MCFSSPGLRQRLVNILLAFFSGFGIVRAPDPLDEVELHEWV